MHYKRFAIFLPMFVFLVASITPATVSAGKNKMKKRKVYDAEGNFVGFYIQQIRLEHLIFIPNLNAFANVNCDPPRVVDGGIWDGAITMGEFGTFMYESEDGSGIPYLKTSSVYPIGFATNFLLYDSCQDKYYLSTNALTTIVQRSHRGPGDCQASKEGTPEPYSVYEIEEITKDNIPLKLPIPCPLSF